MASTATRCPSDQVSPPPGGTARRPVLPGGNIPACQPMVATMLGSLMVQARAMTSPSASATTVQNRPKRSTAAPLSHPPWAVSQSGVVKWWKVTTGSTPRVAQPEALTAVVGQGGPGDLALGRLDAAPFHREPVVVQAEAGDEVGVLLPALPGVAGVARGFGAARARRVLEGPPVVVGVARPRSGGPPSPCPR